MVNMTHDGQSWDIFSMKKKKKKFAKNDAGGYLKT